MQTVVAQCSNEARIYALTLCIKERFWIKNLDIVPHKTFCEMNMMKILNMSFFEHDSLCQRDIYNLKYVDISNHSDARYLYFVDSVTYRVLELHYISTDAMLADIIIIRLKSTNLEKLLKQAEIPWW